ncbi:MAG: hypothetical protein M1827_006802 [Pycnora praestabilis]|nr:MAG: hypothetical protein M1827_006802 [Pycnora praestabilis]
MVMAYSASSEKPNAGSDGTESMMDMEDIRLSNYLFIIFGSILVALLFYRTVLYSVQYIRTLTCLNNETQRYFAAPNDTFAKMKEHMIYAPLFRSRHKREFRLSSAMSMGILPTRLQTLILGGYLGTNFAFCVIGIDWNGDQETVLSALRNRTGVLAVVNMLLLVILGGRTNPLIAILNIPFDVFNLMHRWLGRMVVLEALCHTLAWTIAKVHGSGWAVVKASISHSDMIMTGFIGVVALVAISIQSLSVVRHAFYETFLHLHNALVILAIFGIWIHLKGLAQQRFIVGVVIIWVAHRFIRLVSLMYRNVGSSGTKALVEALPGDAMRVTLKMARPWTFKPGQHVYLYMPSVGLWTSHPFSVAWSEEEDSFSAEKGLAMNRQDILETQKTSMSLIIRRRTGFTDSLYKRAERGIDQKITIRALAEGPYGGSHTLHSYGTVMIFAGGVGITHQVPYVRDLVAGYGNGTVAARKVVLVWIIQNPEHLEWIRPWMTTILAMDKRRDVLRILLFVTRPRSTKEIHSPSATVQMFPGKPNVETLIDMETANQVGAMGVTVCGTGSLSDDVRRAVRRRQSSSNIDFVEQSFSW